MGEIESDVEGRPNFVEFHSTNSTFDAALTLDPPWCAVSYCVDKSSPE